MTIIGWGAFAVWFPSVVAIEGWWDAVGCSMVLLAPWATLTVIQNPGWIRARNADKLTREKAHHVAESIITRMADAIGTDAACDLALEASSILDDMAAAGATGDELMEEARRLSMRFLIQVRTRARTKVAVPEVQPRPSEYRRRSKKQYPLWMGF